MDGTAQRRVERLATRWPTHAPFRPEGPEPEASLFVGEGAVARFERPARLRAEHEGAARVAPHPALPRVLDREDDVELLEPFGSPLADPTAAVLAWPWDEAVRCSMRRRDLLIRLSNGRRLDRAARSLDVPRRHVDRWLDAEIEMASAEGVDFGGVSNELHRGRPLGAPGLVLRRDRARSKGWLATELAALAVDPAVHRAANAEVSPAAADAAFELADFAVRLREATLASDVEALASLARLLRPDPEPSRVRVWISGPAWLEPRAWEAPGASVSAARARWLLRELDGMAIGGEAIRVRTEPSVRPGRRSPRREARGVRDRRLFSRFAEGVRLDDEARFSLTPEALARRLARGACGVVLDATCGAGGLAIAFAREPGVERVIAVDRNGERLAMARHNAAVYGVASRCEFIVGDARDIVAGSNADLLVVDPPWGGRDYDRVRMGLEDLPMDVAGLLARHRNEVLLKLPRSFDPATLPGAGWRLEAVVDERGAFKFITARRR